MATDKPQRTVVLTIDENCRLRGIYAFRPQPRIANGRKSILMLERTAAAFGDIDYARGHEFAHFEHAELEPKQCETPQ